VNIGGAGSYVYDAPPVKEAPAAVSTETDGKPEGGEKKAPGPRGPVKGESQRPSGERDETRG